MTPKTRVYLIRHGEVEGAGVPRYNGHNDVALSARGVEMYHELKPRFAEAAIAACYSSDLRRCAVGAAIFGEHLGLEPVITATLREQSVGLWEGLTWQELMERYPQEWQERLADIVNYRTPRGENLIDVQARVIPTIRDIVARHVGEEVLVVAHGGVNRVILLDALGAPLSSLFSMEQKYCGLNIIDYYADGKSVVKLLNG